MAESAVARRERRSAEAKRVPAPERVAAAPRARGLGNQGLRRVLQTQLGAGSRGLEFEAEADWAAERVSTAAAGGHCTCGRPVVRNGLCADCARTRATVAPLLAGLPLSVERSLRRQGRPLDEVVRAELEEAVGADLGEVRLHTGSEATEAARALRARAFTTGSHIVFGAGEYAPQTAAGRRLLAHEAAHTVQQEHAPPVIQRTPDPTPPPAVVELGPCDVDVPSLTNEGLVHQLQRASTFLRTHERGDDYYDHANLMRRAVEERNKRARAGHVWLLEDPPAIPTVLYELQPGGELQVNVIPASVANELGSPSGSTTTSVMTPGQLNRFLERENIPQVDAAAWFAQQDQRNPEPLRFLMPPPAPTRPDPFLNPLSPFAPVQSPLLGGSGPFSLLGAPSGAPSSTIVAGGGLYQSPFDIVSRPNVAQPVFSPNVDQTSPRSVSGGRVEWRGDLPEVSTGWRGGSRILTYQDLNRIQGDFRVFDWRQRFTGNLISVTHSLPESGSWTPGSTGASSDPTAAPEPGGYREKFRRAIGTSRQQGQQANFATMITDLNAAYRTNLTPVDVAGQAFLAVPDDHVQAVQNDVERSMRRSPGNYVNLIDAMLRDRPITIQRPGQTNLVIGSWNDLQAARANSTITVAEFNTHVGDLATSAKAHIIPSGITTVQIARLENFRMQWQSLSEAEFSARFPPEYLESVRLGGAMPAIHEAGVRGARTSAAIAGGIDLARMAWRGDASQQALTQTAIDMTTAYGGGYLSSTIESGVMIGTTEAFTGATGAWASAGQFGGRFVGGGIGGGIAAPLVTMAAMGLDPYHSYTGIDYAARGGRAFVAGASAGAGGAAGGALAAAGIGALAGTEVPIVGNIVGFFVGLGVYYLVDSTVGEDVERQIRLDLGEGGCVRRTPSTTTTNRPLDVYPGGFCFAAGTLVRMADGSERPIDDLESGDEVLGYDDGTATFRSVAVIGNTPHFGRACLELTLDTGSRLRVTPGHPLRSDRLWLAAGGVAEGTVLTCLGDGGEAESRPVVSVVPDPLPATVYELSVGGCHTYFAGGILAHNKNM